MRDDTPVTLRELLEHQIKAERDVIDQRFIEMNRALELRAETNTREVNLLKDNVERIAMLHADAHAREHELTTIALEKAERAMEHRLENVNEFRGQLRDQAATFASRDLMDERLGVITTRIEREVESIDARLKVLEHNAANMSGRLWSMGVGVGLLIIVINLAFRWLTP